MGLQRIFNCIALLGQPRTATGLTTHVRIYHWLRSHGYATLIEQQLAKVLNLPHSTAASFTEIGLQADLAVVVGGDGNMLNVARKLAPYPTMLLGVNQGQLGFLTDLDPEQLHTQLEAIFSGHYTTERRWLLEASIEGEKLQQQNLAINEIVVHSSKIAHLIEFAVYIDDHFAFAQRSDGLIVATPTGSTAYSLSSGGPILTPTLNALVLVPMAPHMLSSRPLVIDSTSTLRLCFPHHHQLHIYCDGQNKIPVQPQQTVVIRKSQHHWYLVHPTTYHYFNRLSDKLGWLKKIY